MHGRNRLRRMIPALALTALVAATAIPAQAQKVSRPSAPVVRAGWSTGAREFLSQIWQGGRQGLHSLFGAEGASLDPHGGAPTNGSGAGGGTTATVGHGGV
jgi:hypothetical protein